MTVCLGVLTFPLSGVISTAIATNVLSFEFNAGVLCKSFGLCVTLRFQDIKVN